MTTATSGRRETAVEPVVTETRTTALVPTTMGEAVTMAERLAQSGLIPMPLRGKPADVLVILMTGRELGLAPMQSLRSINVIQGKAAMSADLMQALVVASPACEYFQLVESTADVAAYETRRRGNPSPTRMTYSMEDAKAAGLASNDNYRKNAAAMLRARCKSALCRAEYPDLVLNVYDPEELRGMPPETTSIVTTTHDDPDLPEIPQERPPASPATKKQTASQKLGLDEPPPPEPGSDDGPLTWTGALVSVNEKAASNGKPFWIVADEDSSFTARTFSQTVADTLIDAIRDKQEVTITYEVGKFGKKVVSVLPF